MLHESKPHSYEKLFYWSRVLQEFARITKLKWAGRRVCIDLFASSGMYRDRKSGQLGWGSPLLALHAIDPFDVYIFGEKRAKRAAALAERAEDTNTASHVARLNLSDPDVMHAAREFKALQTSGPNGCDHSAGAPEQRRESENPHERRRSAGFAESAVDARLDLRAREACEEPVGELVPRPRWKDDVEDRDQQRDERNEREEDAVCDRRRELRPGMATVRRGRRAESPIGGSYQPAHRRSLPVRTEPCGSLFRYRS